MKSIYFIFNKQNKISKVERQTYVNLPSHLKNVTHPTKHIQTFLLIHIL